MNKKNIIFIIVSTLLLLAAIFVFISICITHKIEENSRDEYPALTDNLEKQDSQEKKALAPSRPEDYGMIALDQGNMPKTQAEWDSVLAPKIKEAKAMLSAEENKKMRAVIEEDAKKTAEKMKQIEEGIKKCNEALKVNPNSQEIKDKLARYMMLKSIAKELSQE